MIYQKTAYGTRLYSAKMQIMQQVLDYMDGNSVSFDDIIKRNTPDEPLYENHSTHPISEKGSCIADHEAKTAGKSKRKSHAWQSLQF